jgi:hypothetical protein
MKGGLPEEFLKRWGDFGVLAGFESVDGRKEGAQKLKFEYDRFSYLVLILMLF